MPQGIQSAIHYNKPILTQGPEPVNHLSVVDLVGAAAHDTAIRLVVDDLGEFGIAQHAAAEQARLARCETAVSVDADDVDRRAFHRRGVGIDDGVLLGVDGHAELIVLPLRHVEALALTVARVDAVGLAARRAVVARADDDLVLDDDGTVAAAQAGRAAADGLSAVEEVFRPVGTMLFLNNERSPLNNAMRG